MLDVFVYLNYNFKVKSLIVLANEKGNLNLFKILIFNMVDILYLKILFLV